MACDLNQLTGLPDMHTFHELVAASAARCEADGCLDDYATVYFNIANFKAYNRMEGIAAGDALLAFVAGTITRTFGEETLVGHVGADNFVAFLPKAGLLDALETICRTVNGHIGDSAVLLKAGVHLSNGKTMTQTLERVLDLAKIAADDIKRDATVSVRVYTDAMGEAVTTRTFVLRNFERALEEDHIVVYFQPVVRTLTEKLCGFEALARWDDPERGLISPGAFIPVLEETKLITKLDMYIIEQVGRKMSARLKAGKPIVPVSVNLSKIDFEMVDPFAVVEDIVTRYSLPRIYLHIEVTETMMAWNQNRLLEVLGNFHDAGYQVWLDDFGSEYSSLRFLHNFHFDELKIDMDFFRNFNAKSRQIIESVVLMAKALGMQTLAEGVETAEQVEFLRSIGCGKIQGFYYGRPLPEDETLTAYKARTKGYETPVDKEIYDKTELINIITDAPTAIFHFNGDYPTYLVENPAYLAETASAGYGSLDAQNVLVRSKNFPHKQRFRRFFDKVGRTRQEQNLLFVDDGQYMSLKASRIAGMPNDYVGVAHLANMTFSEKEKRVTLFDKAMRSILAFFDGLYYLDMTADTIHAISSAHYVLKEDETYHGVKKNLALYARVFIPEGQRERFIAFFDPDALTRNFEKGNSESVTAVFDVKGRDGAYHRTIFHVTAIGKTIPLDLLVSEERERSATAGFVE